MMGEDIAAEWVSSGTLKAVIGSGVGIRFWELAGADSIPVYPAATGDNDRL
jgi:hypothetical protein